jgi:hypothetical protein
VAVSSGELVFLLNRVNEEKDMKSFMKIFGLALALLFLGAWSVEAAVPPTIDGASIWRPSSDYGSIFFSIDWGGAKFGIFDDIDTSLTNPLVTFVSIATITISKEGDGKQWTVNAVDQAPGYLTDTNHFLLGYASPDSTWVRESYSQALSFPQDTYQLVFGPSAAPKTMVGVGIAAIPLPAAAWLMCLGVMGLLYIGRRKAED